MHCRSQMELGKQCATLVCVYISACVGQLVRSVCVRLAVGQSVFRRKEAGVDGWVFGVGWVTFPSFCSFAVQRPHSQQHSGGSSERATTPNPSGILGTFSLWSQVTTYTHSEHTTHSHTKHHQQLVHYILS